MFSAEYLWEIYFLEVCHFFVECRGWGFYLIVEEGEAAGERNAEAKHRRLAEKKQSKNNNNKMK